MTTNYVHFKTNNVSPFFSLVLSSFNHVTACFNIFPSLWLLSGCNKCEKVIKSLDEDVELLESLNVTLGVQFSRVHGDKSGQHALFGDTNRKDQRHSCLLVAASCTPRNHHRVVCEAEILSEILDALRKDSQDEKSVNEEKLEGGSCR